jgi:hypothetical protein
MNDFIKFLEKYNITADEFVELYKLQPSEENDQKILNEGLEFFKKSKVKPLPKQLAEGNDRTEEYIELWPKMQLPSGKPARASRKVLLRCFTWFFSNYSYDWNIVLQATEKYVTTQSDNAFRMCRTNQYFVDKTNGGIRESLLADYCELIINGEENSGPQIVQKVV